jgi:hypothetical protein
MAGWLEIVQQYIRLIYLVLASSSTVSAITLQMMSIEIEKLTPSCIV